MKELESPRRTLDLPLELAHSPELLARVADAEADVARANDAVRQAERAVADVEGQLEQIATAAVLETESLVGSLKDADAGAISTGLGRLSKAPSIGRERSREVLMALLDVRHGALADAQHRRAVALAQLASARADDLEESITRATADLSQALQLACDLAVEIQRAKDELRMVRPLEGAALVPAVDGPGVELLKRLFADIQHAAGTGALEVSRRVLAPYLQTNESEVLQ